MNQSLQRRFSAIAEKNLSEESQFGFIVLSSVLSASPALICPCLMCDSMGC